MNGEDEEKGHDRSFRDEVEKREVRKLRARKSAQRSVWYGLGLFGIVGWSVAIPTLIGVAIGIWIDRRYPGPYSWTLILLFAGLLAGCLVAWHWVNRERKDIEKERENE